MMPTAKPQTQHDDLEQHKRQTLNALIGEQVIHSLGTPDGRYKVQVRRLWEDHYRVNIFPGEDAAYTTIARSYFVEADGNGNIVASSPKITKVYPTDALPPSLRRT